MTANSLGSYITMKMWTCSLVIYSLRIIFNLLLSYGSVVASWKISLVLVWDTSIDIMSHIPTRRLMLLS